MSLSCLTDSSVRLIADASTIINLNASGRAKEILGAVPNKLAIMDIVQQELGFDRRSGRNDAALTGELIGCGRITVTALKSLKENHFENLVAGPAVETLDDGEAATIAHAVEMASLPLIDERKAITLCTRKYPNLAVGRTVDIFAHQSVEHALGRATLADSVFQALQQARMRVSPHHEQWVVDLIGNDRAKLCPSLPLRLRTSS